MEGMKQEAEKIPLSPDGLFAGASDREVFIRKAAVQILSGFGAEALKHDDFREVAERACRLAIQVEATARYMTRPRPELPPVTAEDFEIGPYHRGTSWCMFGVQHGEDSYHRATDAASDADIDKAVDSAVLRLEIADPEPFKARLRERLREWAAAQS